MSGNWKDVLIKDLGLVVTGATPKGANDDRFNGSLPFITPTDLDVDRRTPRITRFISDSAAAQVSKRILPPRTICFTCIGATIGKVCLTDALAVTNQQINSVIVNPQLHDPAFVYYRLLADRDKIKARAGGAATPIISKSAFEQILVRIPELSVQQKIAAVLSPYDYLIENNYRRIDILEEMVQRIYREWFVDFRYPGYEAVPLVDSELGLVPQGWDAGVLDDLVVLQRGFDLPKSQRELGTVPVIAATGRHGTHSQAKVKGPGVVTGRSGSLGSVMYIVEDFWPLNTTLWVKEYRRATPELAYFLLQSLGLAGYNSGAAVPTLNRNDISQLPRTLPPPNLIDQFSQHVRNVLAGVRIIERSTDMLRATRDFLLPSLISGEIDVSDLSIVMSEAAV